jgi:hypothetical protein
LRNKATQIPGVRLAKAGDITEVVESVMSKNGKENLCSIFAAVIDFGLGITSLWLIGKWVKFIIFLQKQTSTPYYICAHQKYLSERCISQKDL